MENPKKAKEYSGHKESTSHSFKSQVGECASFWLLRGPPFDQRDYMISPSESATTLPSQKGSECPKKKFGPSDIKIDSKYLLDSQKALKKISYLIKDGQAEQLIDRLEELIKFFLQGSPTGFLVDDLPLVIEIVEFFSRNRSSVPKYTEFVKTIMQYGSEPPKVHKTSDILYCKDALADYFTLFGELLATFEDECFQLHLLESLDCLIIRRKLVDLCCVNLTTCHEALEESQLPCIVAALMETVPNSLYIHYLELTLQMVWVSIKIGYVMAQTNVVRFAIRRMNPLPPGDNPEALEKESELYDYYCLLDKSAYLIWSLFAIAGKYNLEIPVLDQSALWSLTCVFHREAKKKSQKAVDIRNNLAAILAKLYGIYGDKLPGNHTGLVGYLAAMAVATEIKSESLNVEGISLGTSKGDFVLKKLLLLCCCFFSRHQNLITALIQHKVIEGILGLINPKSTLPWIPSQFVSLLCVGFRTLSELVPRLPEIYLLNKGNARLLGTIKWLMQENFDQDTLLEALKTLCVIVTCGNESIIKDVKAKGGVKILIDVCSRLLDVTFMKLEHQFKLARVFFTLERLFANDVKMQREFKESCVSISVKLLRRILADSANDSKWHSNVVLSFGGFLWEAVAWCSSSLKLFLENSGIFFLLDFIESSCFPTQMLYLGVLVDMTDEGETISHLLTWRGKDGGGILSLLIDIWQKEEYMTKVHRTRDGIIQDVEAPLMTEEQWYLTHQVTGCHIYSPSIAEMVGSARPKVHAMYQFLQRRYFPLTQLGESNYCLQVKAVKPSHQVYIPLIEHFLALKMGEIWSEVIRDAITSGVLPTSFDGDMICTLLNEKNKWASRVKTIQEEISLKASRGNSGSEKEFYMFLKTCLLPSALEALRDLDYIARTSFQKFQKQKKSKQISELKSSIENIVPEDEFFHSTFLRNTNTTFMGSGNIWIKSENLYETEDLVLVSPESCGNIRFDRFEDI